MNLCPRCARDVPMDNIYCVCGQQTRFAYASGPSVPMRNPITLTIMQVYGISYVDRDRDNYNRSRFSEEYGVWLDESKRDAKLREMNQETVDRLNVPSLSRWNAERIRIEEFNKGNLFPVPEVAPYVPEFDHENFWRRAEEYYSSEDIDVNQ